MNFTDSLDIHSLMEAASELPDGSRHKIELLERAVDLADSLQDVRLGYSTRKQLIRATSYGGFPEKTVVAFAWQLAAWDKHGPEVLQTSSYMVMWHYKWVINSLWEFDTISRGQIEAAFADFEARLEREGYSLRTVLYFRWKYAFFTGQLEQTDARRAAWLVANKDHMSDCAACETHFLHDYLVGMGRYTEAFETVQPVLTGKQSCLHVPALTYGSVLESMLHLGQLDEAMNMHVRGYPLVRDNPTFFETCGEHLVFLAYTHNLEPALKLLEVHLPWALETANQMGRFGFLQKVLPLWARLRQAGQARVQLNLPSSIPLERNEEGYALDALEGWLRTQLEDLAHRFDTRNGNTHFSSQLQVDATLLERIPAVPLRPDRFSSKIKNWKGKL